MEVQGVVDRIGDPVVIETVVTDFFSETILMRIIRMTCVVTIGDFLKGMADTETVPVHVATDDHEDTDRNVVVRDVSQPKGTTLWMNTT